MPYGALILGNETQLVCGTMSVSRGWLEVGVTTWNDSSILTILFRFFHWFLWTRGGHIHFTTPLYLSLSVEATGTSPVCVGTKFERWGEERHD